MKINRWVCLAIGFALCGSSPASAQVLFSDSFETYTAGNPLPPQGGWIDFGGTQPILVSANQAQNGSNSMQLAEGAAPGYGSDVYRNFGGLITSGILNLRYWQFAETGVDTVSHMYISTGDMPTTFEAGLWLLGTSGPGGAVTPGTNLILTRGGNTTPLASPVAQVFGAWAEHNLTINLDANTFDYSYNGSSVVSGLTWDENTANGVSFGGINFWMGDGNANGITNFVYYDNFSLTVVPEPSSMALVGLGMAGAAWWRRKRR